MPARACASRDSPFVCVRDNNIIIALAATARLGGRGGRSIGHPTSQARPCRRFKCDDIDRDRDNHTGTVASAIVHAGFIIFL